MSITGARDGEPQKVGVALVDVLAGLFSTVGILAALEYRRQSGEGQRVEVDLLSALLAGLVNQASAYTVAGVVPGRMGNEHPSVAPYEPLRCADQELVVAVGTDRQFAALCEVLGVPELARDPRFETNKARVANRGAMRAALEQRLAARPAGRMGADADRRARAGRCCQRHRCRVRARARARTRAGREHRARGRHDDRARPQPDQVVGDACELPLRAAPVPGGRVGRGVRKSGRVEQGGRSGNRRRAGAAAGPPRSPR